MDISEIINELGEDRDSYFHAIAPPIIQTSNFAFRTVDIFRQALSREYDHMVYSRGKNPPTEFKPETYKSPPHVTLNDELMKTVYQSLIHI